MSRKLLRKLKQKDPPDLDITAFMNLMVVLVPFLLVTAVFSRVSILQLDLPAAVGPGEAAEKKLEVEVIVRKDRIELSDGEQIVLRIPNIPRAELAQAAGDAPAPAAAPVPGEEVRADQHDLATLNKELATIKRNYPDKLDAIVLMEPELEYDILVQVMDTVSTVVVPEAETGKMKRYDLFPQISVGDAPVIGGKS
jgi:biopolymer transport protein ExbD